LLSEREPDSVRQRCVEARGGQGDAEQTEEVGHPSHRPGQRRLHTRTVCVPQ